MNVQFSSYYVMIIGYQQIRWFRAVTVVTVVIQSGAPNARCSVIIYPFTKFVAKRTSLMLEIVLLYPPHSPFAPVEIFSS